MERLKKILSNMDTALVAFSGGVDSTLLLKAATMYVKKRVVAVTFFGEIFSSRDVSSALELAKHIGVERHIFLEAGVMDDERFRSNPIDRCYYCKRILYKNLKEIAEEEELSFILDGTNSDDKHDYRPGMKAAEEFGIVSPLLEAGLGKKEIRNIAKSMGLPNWDKPSSPCLATRIPYGSSITEDALRRIEKAENFLKDMGISQCRVRHYDIIASIEVEPSVMNEIIKKRREIIHFFSEVCGYKSVHLDIEGFRSGKLNSLI